MDTNMLPEEKRQQLDGIVQKMIQNKESDSNIQFVVKDFTEKYSAQIPLQKPKKDFLQKTTDVVTSIFPGKQVGEAIGTLAGATIANFKGMGDQYDLSAPTPLQVTGDIAQGALTVAAPGATAPTAAGRIGVNAALGAGIGGAGSIAEGDSAKEVLGATALGGALGAGVSTVGEGLNALVTHAPRWFTKLALPKLENTKVSMTGKNPQDIVDYTLENTKVGSLKSVYNKSNESIKGYSSQINTILKHPEYAAETGDIASAVPKLLADLPDAQLDNKQVSSILKNVVPQSKTLIDKVVDGTATISEQNSLRQQLDLASRKIFTDNPDVSFNKQIAAKLSNILRQNVQQTAPETVPIFANFSKELNLNNAILQAAKKRKVMGDLIAGAAGGIAGGLKGAAAAIALERTVRSPAALLAGAKAIKAAGKAKPVVSGVGKVLKAPILREATK